MPTFKSIIQNIKANNRDRKRQEENDTLAQSIIASTTAQQKHPELRTPIDKPLVDEHPGLDLALMYAQPGSILTKALAPSAYKNMIQGFINGEGAQAILSGIGVAKPSYLSRTAKAYQKSWPDWRQKLESAKDGDYSSLANHTREAGFNRYSRVRLRRPELATTPLTEEAWHNYTLQSNQAHEALRQWELVGKRQGKPMPESVETFLGFRKTFFREHPDIFSLLNSGGTIKSIF